MSKNACVWLCFVAAVAVIPVSAEAAPPTPAVHDEAALAASGFECGYRSHDEWLAEFQAAVARGEVVDPTSRPLPMVAPGRPRSATAADCGLSREQIFAFEDTDRLLLTNYSTGQLLGLMTEAANTVLAAHGDNYDFIGYWVNFEPHHKIGAAFYALIENNVRGIGLDPFNRRPDYGLAGENIEGFIMMWNINSSHWQPGEGQNADFTRLALAQEFEHRFAMFLPPLPDGRVLQGDNGNCGRVAHWNWQVDGQGSGMEIAEWVGANPAILEQKFVSFNTDIGGGVFSYSDLYLMGYVSGAEMDAGNSELRFMDTSDCSRQYFGDISTFASADIIASAGQRVPSSQNSQKNFRTAWVMIHLPGDPPSGAELDKATAILEQHQRDWRFSTLGLGTMDNSLLVNCECIDKFKVRCRNNKLKAKIKSTLAEGAELTIDNGGDQKTLTIRSTGAGKVKWKNQTGQHEVSVVECKNRNTKVDCGV